MLTNRSFLTGLLILGVIGLPAGRGAAVERSLSARERLNAGKMAAQAQAPSNPGNGAALRRATKLIGEPLKNTQGQKLGKIDDLVLTPTLNQVSYAVLTRGGFFGFRERRYAIPWTAMQAGVGDTIVAPIDKQELERNPGFPKNLWPAQGDPRWLSRAGARTEAVTFDAQPMAAQREIQRRRVSRILGMTARDPADQRVGKVKDMVVALRSGDVPFTIVSFGGLFGFGDKYTAVPAGVVALHPSEHTAGIQVGKAVLQANAFKPSRFPDLADPVYSRRLYTAYDVTPPGLGSTVLGYVPPEDSARTQTQTQTATPAQPQVQQPAQGRTPIPGLQTPQTPAAGSIQSQYLSIFAPQNRRTIEGVVTGVSSFKLVGTNAEWVQFQVRADDGELFTVQLGPRDYVGKQNFYVAANDRITLTGAQATAWRQPIILPITATVGNETIRLRDESGRPLWTEAANGGTGAAGTTPPAGDTGTTAPGGDTGATGTPGAGGDTNPQAGTTATQPAL